MGTDVEAAKVVDNILKQEIFSPFHGDYGGTSLDQLVEQLPGLDRRTTLEELLQMPTPRFVYVGETGQSKVGAVIYSGQTCCVAAAALAILPERWSLRDVLLSDRAQ